LLAILSKGFAQPPTLLGLHGVTSHIPSMGAQILRSGTNDYTIRNAIINNDSTAIKRTETLKSLGYTQVIYLIHNESDDVNIVDKAWQRIPVGTDSLEVFQYLDTFLLNVGPNIDWIQINQEPFGITPYDTTLYSISEIIDWWKTLAGFINEKRLHTSSLSHLKILSPSISSMIPKPEVLPFFDSLIAFGEEYCGAISLHIYPEDVDHGRQVVEYYRSRTLHPLACSEFSQAKAGEYTGWFDNINTVWTDKSDTFYGLTNKAVINTAYTSQMTPNEWETFLNTAPYTDNFISEMYAVMDSNCFIFSCYAGYWQYGEPIFDWANLLANKTVNEEYSNSRFYTEFVNLAYSINSDNFQSQCQTTSSINRSLDVNKGVTVYPNPSHNQFNLSFNKQVEDVTLNLYDQRGNLIFIENNISGFHYTVSDIRLDTGCYYIQLLYNSKSIGEYKIVICK
jgi:hypothetical protein